MMLNIKWKKLIHLNYIKCLNFYKIGYIILLEYDIIKKITKYYN